MAVGLPCRFLGPVTTRAPLRLPYQAPEDIFPSPFRKICFLLGVPGREQEQGTRRNPRGKSLGYLGGLFGASYLIVNGFVRSDGCRAPMQAFRACYNKGAS